MAKQHLYHAQIRAVVEQVRRERVPQCMRRQIAIDARLARIALDDVPERLARHAIPTAGRKQAIGAAIEQDVVAGPRIESLEPAHRFLAERNQALAVALADHPHYALMEV